MAELWNGGMDHTYLLTAILPVIAAVLCATLYSLWLKQRESRHVLNWSLAYACAVLGSAISLARLVIENAAPFSLVANAFLVGVAFFAARGALLLHGGRPADRVTVPILLATILAGLWFGFASPSVFWRGTTASVGAALIFLIATKAISENPGRDRIDRLIGLVFVLTAATLVARPALAFIVEGPIESEAEVTSAFWGVSFRIFAMLSWCAMAVLFLLRATSDLMAEATAQSLTDPLTGIGNRRGFFAAAEAALAATGREAPATLLLCDIDAFKQVNDSYGHATGDLVIRELANVLIGAVDGSGAILGRLGGEEFVVLLPATPLEAALAAAQAIRTDYARRSRRIPPLQNPVTVSIGIAETAGDEGLEAVIERADAALYRAKRKGRDRVEIAGSAEDAPEALPRGTSHTRRHRRAFTAPGPRTRARP